MLRRGAMWVEPGQLVLEAAIAALGRTHPQQQSNILRTHKPFFHDQRVDFGSVGSVAKAGQRAQPRFGSRPVSQYRLELAAVRQRRANRLGNRMIAHQAEQRLDRVGMGAFLQSGRQHAFSRRQNHRCALIVLDHGEIEWHPRLQRKPMQHRFAERVDGDDLEPAGRFQRLGEQGPRQRAHRIVDRPRHHPAQLVLQLHFAHRRPAGQQLGNPAAHLRRRRLGIGQA